MYTTTYCSKCSTLIFTVIIFRILGTFTIVSTKVHQKIFHIAFEFYDPTTPCNPRLLLQAWFLLSANFCNKQYFRTCFIFPRNVNGKSFRSPFPLHLSKGWFDAHLSSKNISVHLFIVDLIASNETARPIDSSVTRTQLPGHTTSPSIPFTFVQQISREIIMRTSER